MNRRAAALFAALLIGCASTADVKLAVAPGMTSGEVASRAGTPARVGKLADGSAYWDYSRQPYYASRVVFGPDDRVREVRDLLTAQNFENLRPGMTEDEVIATVGPASIFNRYGNGTTVWTYRYQDVGVYKLLHVTFDASRRLLRHETEWDPDVYSKRDGGGPR